MFQFIKDCTGLNSLGGEQNIKQVYCTDIKYTLKKENFLVKTIVNYLCIFFNYIRFFNLYQ